MSGIPEGEFTWRAYERLVAAFESQNVGLELTATPNARIKGHISGRWRQIDVLIDARWGDDLSRRIIVDAKCRTRKLDIKDVESFEGMMKDCNATYGILVSPKGWSEGAYRRAQDAITMKLLTFEELGERACWADFDECIGECSLDPGKHVRKGLVLWSDYHALTIDGSVAVVATGKCDVCHNFHVWCWVCGDRFAIGEEDEQQCNCQHLWASAIEEEVDDATGETLNAVHLLLLIGDRFLSLDRRRLR